MIIKLLTIVLLADLFSGVGHWLQDRYFSITTPIIGSIIRDNIAHHKEPYKFLNTNYFERNNTMIFLCFLGILFFVLIGSFSLYKLIFLVYLSQVNEIHAISHNPTPNIYIMFLQAFGFVQPYKHHQKHHNAPNDLNYCILTTFLNPILDTLGFWLKLEYLLLKINIKPRN